MPISTSLNNSPYFDQWSLNRDYYRVLFQPGVSVQTQELNELQSIFQNQIEQFGDNIFQTGSIVSGCVFNALPNLNYVTVQDTDNNNNPVNVDVLQGYTMMNDVTGLRSTITTFADGFQTTPPNLKTLYITYQNTGTNGNTISYSSGDVLRIFDATINGIESITVNGGGIGFSNNDVVIAQSAAIVTITTGSLTVGDYLSNGLGANVQIVSVDSTTLASKNQYIVTTSPRIVDLVNTTPSTIPWTLGPNQSITNPAATFTGTIVNTIGSGFVGKINTNGVGSIQTIDVLQKGNSYTTVPYITIQHVGGNSTNYNGLTLSPLNYVTKPIVVGVGQGYGFQIASGVIYQKGTFLQVNPQIILIDKYSNYPDNVAVVFTTSENTVDANQDNTLFDNAANTTNYQAPGANRLQLTPTLQTTDSVTASSNSQLLTLMTWAQGQPITQNQQTVYSVIGDDIAERVFDVSGNFVIDPWLVTTTSPTSSNNEGQYFNIVVDPGSGYIDGYKVQTGNNYQILVPKGTNTAITNSHYTSLAYGNYVIINNVGGTFQFNTGDTVTFYDTAAGFANSIANGVFNETISPVGNILGTASLRSMLLYQGQPGTASAQYALYLFNIQMNAGANFANIRSIYYNGTNKGIGDTVLLTDPLTGQSDCQLQVIQEDGLVFDFGVESLKNANGCSFIYRTLDQSVSISNTGILIKDISGLTGKTYPYTGNLSNINLNDFIVVPYGADMLFAAASGTVTANTTTANLVGSNTSFASNFASGDYIYVSANGTGGHDIHRVQNVVNNTLMILDSNCSYSNTTAIVARCFPKNIPVPFGYRSGLSGNVNLAQTLLTLNFGNTFTFSGTESAAIACNIQIGSATQGTKTPTRNAFVLINTSNNAGGSTGPWCLGVPDVFRLRGVYFVTANNISNTGTNYVSNFFVDNGQNIDFYNLSYLNIVPKSTVTLTNSQQVLVQFDYFTSNISNGGFYTTVSYLGSNAANILSNDSLPLASLGSNVNSFEIPEFFDQNGNEIDLLHYLDFRPYAANTCVPSTTPSSAPVNPSNTISFNTTVEKSFPQPSSQFLAGQIEYYLGRTDSVVINQNAIISEIQGGANSALAYRSPPSLPVNSMLLTNISIPAYPNLPINLSVNMTQIINTNIATNAYVATRDASKTINNSGLAANPSLEANNSLPYTQPRNYTQADIGNIDRRLTNVENEIALSALEANVSNMNIPSSVTPTQNRFQYGFFVDNFTTSDYSDLNNPQYEAMLDLTTGDIIPTKMAWDVSVVGSGPPNWIDSPIASQPIATVGGPTDPTGLGPVCAINLANTVAYQLLFRNGSDIVSGNTDTINVTFASSATVTETIQYVNTPLSTYLAQTNPQFVVGEFVGTVVQPGGAPTPTARTDFQFNQNGTITLAGHANDITYSILSTAITPQTAMPSGGTYVGTVYQPPVSLYFYCFDTPTLINIYQNGTLIATTNTSASGPTTPVDLTQAEITLLESSTAQQWFNVYPQYYMQNFTDTGSGFVKYAGKLTFNYNPALGDNFTITTESGSFVWRWVLAYPINGSSVGCVPSQQFNDISGTYTQNWESVYIQCGNGAEFTGNLLVGYTEVWSTQPTPVPQTVVVPYSIAQDWAG